MKNGCRKRFLSFIVALCMIFTMLVNVPVGKVFAESAIQAEIPIEWGKTYKGRIDFPGIDDINTDYKFELKESGCVYIVTQEVSNGYYYFYDSSNKMIYSYRFRPGTESFGVNLLAGKYTMHVAYTAGVSGGDFSFIPTFEPSNEDISESYVEKNDELGFESMYNIGKTVKAHLAVNENCDYYKFSTKSAGYVSFLFRTAEIGSYHFTIVNSTGSINYESGDISIGAHKYKYFMPSGTYYMNVERGESTSTGTYSFSSSFSSMNKNKVKKAVNKKKKTLSVSWVKNSNAVKYQVQLSKNKEMTKGKKTKTVNNTTNYQGEITKHNLKASFKGLKKGTYYVRVRYAVSINNKVYWSPWSQVKKAKVRK